LVRGKPSVKDYRFIALLGMKVFAAIKFRITGPNYIVVAQIC